MRSSNPWLSLDNTLRLLFFTYYTEDTYTTFQLNKQMVQSVHKAQQEC